MHRICFYIEPDRTVHCKCVYWSVGSAELLNDFFHANIAARADDVLGFLWLPWGDLECHRGAMGKALVRPNKRRADLRATFRSSIAAARESGGDDFYEPAPHRTLPWYLMIMSSGLEGAVRPGKPQLSERRKNSLELAARQVTACLRVMVIDKETLPSPSVVRRALWLITPTKLAFERLSYYVIAELQAQLEVALQTDGRQGLGEKLIDSSRASPRKRWQLPDPDQPAWASVNRMQSKKVQIPCRIDAKMKSLLEEEAAKQGVSQSRWLEEAIAERLERLGHPIDLPKPEKAPARKAQPHKPRRPQRRSIPNPDKSVNATVNRTDQPTTVRVTEEMMAEIDKARGAVDRSAWLNSAIDAFLAEKAKLPAAPEAYGKLSEPIWLRFDKDQHAKIKAMLKKSDISQSEWFRVRCALVYR